MHLAMLAIFFKFQAIFQLFFILLGMIIHSSTLGTFQAYNSIL